jgi:PAS domain S-box-containing protein
MTGFYERLLDLTLDGICRFRFNDGALLFCNRGLVKILDLTITPQEVCGKRIPELIQYMAKPGEIRGILKAQGAIQGSEYHFKTLKGDDRWIMLDANLVTDEQTGEAVVEAIVRDITEIRNAARKIDEEREHLAVTLSSIGDGLIATDDGGRITLLNPIAEKLTGWPRSEAVGMPLNQVFHIINEYTWQPCENPVSKVLQTGRIVALANHTTLIARNGTARNIADSAAPIRNAEGTIIGVVLVFRDVTDEKRTHNALRKSEEQYRLLFNGMLDAFALHEIICDPAGNPVDYRFLDINPRFEMMTGLRSKDLIGRRVREVLPGTEQSWVDIYGKVALTGEPCHFERYAAALDRHYEITAYRPAPGQFATIFNDITEKKKAEEERKRVEAQFQQVQKLESLGILAGGIAHDFNNLLTGMLGNASLALLDVPEGGTARHSLKQIELSAQRAAELCQQLLAYSGKGRFVIEPINLSELVEEMGNLLRISISKKAALNYALVSPLPSVSGDATQFRQIVMNLIVNASEAIGEDNGVITVETGVRPCDRAYLEQTLLHDNLPEGQYVYFSITDTGCGMDADTLQRIFDPFFSTKFAGRGLGLAAVMGIVRAHKGAIKVRSEPGRGSCFTLLFPSVAAAPIPRTKAEPALPRERLTGTFLVVDDDAIILSLARRTLERFGGRVLTAGDGREAVSVFERHADEIRLVLLDMTMPRMNGEETFRELRRIRPGCLIILSSGYNEAEATSHFLETGPAAFLQKPYRQADLLEMVAAVLKKG